jgi:hypothetical protein
MRSNTPPTQPSTCVPPTIGGQTAIPIDGICIARLDLRAGGEGLTDFLADCGEFGGTSAFNDSIRATCTFPSTPPT